MPNVALSMPSMQLQGKRRTPSRLEWFVFGAFLSACVVFWLLGVVWSSGTLAGKASWFARTLDPRLSMPPIAFVLILGVIGYPFATYARGVLKDLTWLAAPLVGFAYWSLWILPSYLGVSFRISIILGFAGVVLAYCIAGLAGKLRPPRCSACLLRVFGVTIVGLILHMYPYSQLDGYTTYSGTGNNDMFYYSCRAASVAEAPLSERLGYMTDEERGKLYRSSIVASRRKKNAIVGTEFVQASIAAVPGLDDVTAFPVLLGVCFILTVWGVYLGARCGFMISSATALLAIGLLALHPYLFFIEQNGFLHHVCGVVCLVALFPFVVQTFVGRHWRMLPLALLFLAALHVQYRVLTPVGGMICFAIAGLAVAYFFFRWLSLYVVERLRRSGTALKCLAIAAATVLAAAVLAGGALLAVRYGVPEVKKRVPWGFSFYAPATVQELLGVQPRVWLNKNTHTLQPDSVGAHLVTVVVLAFAGAGVCRLLLSRPVRQRVGSAGLLAVLAFLGTVFCMSRVQNPYAQIKFLSYILPFLTILPAAGLMWLPELVCRRPLTVFFGVFFATALLDVNVMNTARSALLNVRHARHFGSFVDRDRKALPALFAEVPRDAVVFLGPMSTWDKAWATYYGRAWDVTTDKLPPFYYVPRGKDKNPLPLLEEWSYRITTEALDHHQPLAQQGRFYLYAH